MLVTYWDEGRGLSKVPNDPYNHDLAEYTAQAEELERIGKFDKKMILIMCDFGVALMMIVILIGERIWR